MNDKQIAFIMCVNNEQEYEEAVFYIEQLQVPKGFTKDIVAVWEAPSMAAGYQAAMESSDAKYKVYMHQDVFIYNKNFIQEIVQIFQSDKQIGAIGMIGRTKLPKQLHFAADWDVGNVLFNSGNKRLERQDYQRWPVSVDAVDGLLIATQYDVNWRIDLFDGWDFYDISQCMEFKKRGYRVAVPYQKQAWCYHDNTYSRLNKYFYYQEIFCKEYQYVGGNHNCLKSDFYLEIKDVVEEMKSQLAILVDIGAKEQLWKIFVEMEGKVHLGLNSFFLLAQIDHLERMSLKESIFWKDGMSSHNLLSKICNLKFKIKRMEFSMEDFAKAMEMLQSTYSVFAIAATVIQYASNIHYCVKKVEQWYVEHHMEDLEAVWKQLTNDY